MTVPTPGGVLNPLVLAAAELVGIDEIYRIGGAQAIAALAYGTATITPVDKIVGPGNAYVAAAKRQVFGKVGIDMIAGPSEILVVADRHNDPAWIAADLLSQAEHDEAAQSILVTDDARFAAAVETAVEPTSPHCRGRKSPRASWQPNGAIFMVADWGEAAALDRPDRARAPRAGARRGRCARRTGSSRRRDLPRPAHARSDRRLHRRPQPCSADRAQCAVCLGPRRARFSEAHLVRALRCREPRGARPVGDPPRRSGGARRARVVAVDPARPRRGGEAAAMAYQSRRIAGITLDEHTVVRRSPDIEHERAVAIFDLLEENHFAPASDRAGPFHLHLSIEENRLNIEVRSVADWGERDDSPAARPVSRHRQGLFHGLRELLRGDPPFEPRANRGDRYGPALAAQ